MGSPWIACSYRIYRRPGSSWVWVPCWQLATAVLVSARPWEEFCWRWDRRRTWGSCLATWEPGLVWPSLSFHWTAEGSAPCCRGVCLGASPCDIATWFGRVFPRSSLQLWASVQSKAPCHPYLVCRRKSVCWVRWRGKWSYGSVDRSGFLSGGLSSNPLRASHLQQFIIYAITITSKYNQRMIRSGNSQLCMVLIGHQLL